ncbi:MAG: DUF4097 family beta strand repeat-containing protein [Gemmatimonadota bacterium]|jgi:hypothetical protein
MTPTVISGRGLVPATLLAVALAAPSGLTAQTETVRLEGQEVAIWNLAGEVSVVPGDGSDVVVRVTRGGEDGDRLELRTGDVEGAASLRVVYPSDRISYRPRGGFRGNTSLRVRSDGTFGGGERVEVSSSGGGMEAWADLRIEVPAGREVAVYLAVGRMEARDVSSDLYLDTHSGAVDVAGVRGRVGVDTGSGSVTVRDVEGSTNVDTGSGSVRLEGVRGDEVIVDTGSGSVTGSTVAARIVDIDTGSGEVALTSVESADIRVDTGSGEVELDVLRDVDRLEVDTGSGDVRVRLPSSLGATIEMDTGSGRIDVDFPVQVRSMERTKIEGTIGDGDGYIVIDTGSGSIRLLRYRS